MDMRDAAQTMAMAIRAVSPRLREFGISLSPLSDRVYSGESEHIRITVVLDWCNVVVMVAPRGSAVNGGKGLDLYYLLQAVAPDVRFLPRRLSSTSEIASELSRQISLIEAHAGALLRGDLSDWGRAVLNYQQYRGPAQGETTMQWAERIRKVASEYYDRGDYVPAEIAYFALQRHGLELTRDEKARKRRAQRMRRH